MAYTKYSLTPANNTAAPPDGAPEGMLPSAVNDTMRDMMAQIRDVGDGVRDGTYTMTAPKITGGTITGVAITSSTGSFTTLSTSSTTTFSGLTASTALALDASKNVVSVTNTGTGNNVLSASPTLTGTIAGASLSLSSLTSGRVTYAGASGLLKDSANMTFDDTSLTLGGQIFLSNNNYIGFKNTSASVSASIFNDTSNFLNLYNSSNTGTIFYANAGERLRLTNTSLYTASGVNVGIGTSSPSCLLEVNQAATSFPGFKISGSSSPGMQIVETSGVTAHFVNDGGGTYFGTTTSYPLIFRTVNTERMRINSDGHLLVNTTSDFNSAFTMSLKVNSSTGGLIIQPGANDYTAIQFNNAAGTGVGSISVSSTLTSYNVTSDQRLKTNIVDAPSGNIDGIKVRSFDWVLNGSHQEYGMVAQELIEVAPYAVTKPKNPDDMMQVDYSKLVPMMIKEIQELKQRIATLENK